MTTGLELSKRKQALIDAVAANSTEDRTCVLRFLDPMDNVLECCVSAIRGERWVSGYPRLTKELLMTADIKKLADSLCADIKESPLGFYVKDSDG